MRRIEGTSYLFSFIGIAILIGTISIALNTFHFLAQSKVTTGKVIQLVPNQSSDSGYTYAPVILFTLEDNKSVKFQSSVSSNPPAHSIGDTVPVIYDPVSPVHAEINSFFNLWFGPLVLGFLGMVFTAVGSGMIIVRIHRAGMIKRLLATGQKIEVPVKEIIRNTTLKINHRSPYQIICEYNDGGMVRVLKSDYIWFDPREYVKTPNLMVYMDPVHHKNYYIDISFLPKLA